MQLCWVYDLLDLLVRTPTDSNVLQLSAFTSNEITQRIFIRLVQPDHFILFIERKSPRWHGGAGRRFRRGESTHRDMMIDEVFPFYLEIKTDLVQHGLFKISRNPIFLGMRVMLIGFFLILPNAATFAILLLGEVLVQVQVRLEEAYLRQLHGMRYNAYRQRVRRWL